MDDTQEVNSLGMGEHLNHLYRWFDKCPLLTVDIKEEEKSSQEPRVTSMVVTCESHEQPRYKVRIWHDYPHALHYIIAQLRKVTVELPAYEIPDYSKTDVSTDEYHARINEFLDLVMTAFPNTKGKVTLQCGANVLGLSTPYGIYQFDEYKQPVLERMFCYHWGADSPR